MSMVCQALYRSSCSKTPLHSLRWRQIHTLSCPRGGGSSPVGCKSGRCWTTLQSSAWRDALYLGHQEVWRYNKLGHLLSILLLLLLLHAPWLASLCSFQSGKAVGSDISQFCRVGWQETDYLVCTCWSKLVMSCQSIRFSVTSRRFLCTWEVFVLFANPLIVITRTKSVQKFRRFINSDFTKDKHKTKSLKVLGKLKYKRLKNCLRIWKGFIDFRQLRSSWLACESQKDTRRTLMN